MLFDLMKHWPIEKTGSFMVGDRSTDIEAAEAADIPGFLFLGDNLLEFVTRIVTNLNGLK
jgi:D-glycero-D-manno-heptose 1,7-bisphosphate phosphatase